MLPPRVGSGPVTHSAELPGLAACVLATVHVTLLTAKTCSEASSVLKTSADTVVCV